MTRTGTIRGLVEGELLKTHVVHLVREPGVSHDLSTLGTLDSDNRIIVVAIRPRKVLWGGIHQSSHDLGSISSIRNHHGVIIGAYVHNHVIHDPTRFIQQQSVLGLTRGDATQIIGQSSVEVRHGTITLHEESPQV
jgi:hypothetical protein